MKRWKIWCIALVLFSAIADRAFAEKPLQTVSVTRAIPTPFRGNTQNRETAKYIFLFIGDGMSVPQRSATDYFYQTMNRPEESKITSDKLRISSLPVQGMTSSHSINSVITDSAAAGTAIATGHKTLNGVISMDVAKKRDFRSIAELAKENSMRVGIVSSVSLDHATPACFYAHEPSRGNYYNIAKQLVESNFEYFGGGYLLGNLPSNRKDQPNLISIAKEKGWTLAEDRETIMALANGKPTGMDALSETNQGPGTLAPPLKRVIAYADYDSKAAMDYQLDQTEEDVTLAEFTKLGITLLDNPDGFFLMVESGKIDWACHANDAASAIGEVLALDEAVNVALEFYAKHPNETLIVVTGDHETGGMTIGFAGTKYKSFPARVAAQKMSYQRFDEIVAKWRNEGISFEEALKVIEQNFGLTDLSDDEAIQLRDAFEQSMLPEKARKHDDHSYTLYGTYEPLTVKSTHLLNRRAGLSWTTWSHTGLPVFTSAIGVGSEAFGGYYDNTQILPKICAAMGL